uniref:Uncharacterized protein LOC114332480 n=1 Tax=Diabrotica virgifera virgifera TaxID=50390 RepID=A0A6P7FZ17_DIAVI
MTKRGNCDSSVVLILISSACESTERTGKEVIDICYELSLKEQDPRNKEHLMDLAFYTKQWRPRFSAAGFFNCNQRCFNFFFSKFIDYLVITLQFDLSLNGG